MAARISKADFDEKVLKSKLPVIVDFTRIHVWPARSWHRFSEISRMIMRISFTYTRSTQTLTESSLMSMR